MRWPRGASLKVTGTPPGCSIHAIQEAETFREGAPRLGSQTGGHPPSGASSSSEAPLALRTDSEQWQPQWVFMRNNQFPLASSFFPFSKSEFSTVPFYIFRGDI